MPEVLRDAKETKPVRAQQGSTSLTSGNTWFGAAVGEGAVQKYTYRKTKEQTDPPKPPHLCVTLEQVLLSKTFGSREVELSTLRPTAPPPFNLHLVFNIQHDMPAW